MLCNNRLLLLFFCFSWLSLLLSGQPALQFQWYVSANADISRLYGEARNDNFRVTSPVKIAKTGIDGFANEYVNLIYNLPEDIYSFDTILMNYEIHKGNISGSGRLTQILPIGFNLLDTVFDNARMEYNDYTLDIYWDELPDDSVFNLTYRVGLSNIYGTFPISSSLYFEKTGRKHKYNADIFINKPFANSEPLVFHEQEPDLKDVEFRVQVRAAYEVKIPVQNLATTYNLKYDIKEDFTNNWYKYSVGSYESYKDAREFRKLIVAEHGVRDAFLVAYCKGKRLNSLVELKNISHEAYPGQRNFDEDGKYYSVQVLALIHSKVSPETIKEKYNLNMDVSKEIYRNWRRYTVGKLTSKKEAMQLRHKLINLGIIDAFVVVYNNGDRIGSPGN